MPRPLLVFRDITTVPRHHLFRFQGVEKELAIEDYEKSLELDPMNTNAVDNLRL